MTDRTSGTETPTVEVDSDRRDELFDVLSHPRRRFTLQYLQNADTPIPLNELTTELRSWEAGGAAAPVPADDVEVALVHSHLPKMADAGFVAYDAAHRTVTLAGRTDEIRSHLRR